jgi:hypothetical protein
MSPGKKVEERLEAARRLERHLEGIAGVVSKDSMTHFVNAGLELLQAANAAMEKMEVPEETKIRFHKAERELLLGWKAAIDAVLAEVDKEIPPKKAAELKKINIKRKAK